MILEAVRYLRPNGQSVMEPHEIPDDLREHVDSMTLYHVNVTLEDIPGHTVNMCLSHPEGDFRFELVLPTDVRETLVTMVREWSPRAFRRWLRDTRAGNRDW